MINAWPLLLIVGALLMRVGLSLYSVGLVRGKNASSTTGRHILDWAIAVLAFWAIGAGIANQTNSPYIGFNPAAVFTPRQVASSYNSVLIEGLACAAIVGSIIVGATAERSRIWPILALCFVTAGVTLPVVLSWTHTTGWLGRLGYTDVAGASFIHVLGATAAFAAVRAVGPRDGKYHRDGSASMIPGHQLTGALTGAWLTVPGAAMFIVAMGASFPQIAVANILLAATAGVFMAALYCQARFSKIDLPILTAAMLGAIAAISASPAFIPGYIAVLIGFVAGLVVPFAVIKLDMAGRIDDITGAVAIHGVGGAWGMLATGLFATLDMRLIEAPSRGKLILIQLAGLVAIVIFTYVISGTTLLILSKCTSLRVKEDEEFDGLDLAEHDVASFPDFQQTTIKSHHLREA